MTRCCVCSKEIEYDLDGPLYADDPHPNGTMIAARNCGGCSEPCHCACAGYLHKFDGQGSEELFCPKCWYAMVKPA